MKTVFITGADGAIGGELCKHYEQNGFFVIAVSRNRTCIQKNKIVLKCDMADSREINKLVKSALECCSSIDIFINCAGIYDNARDSIVKDSDWAMECFKVNAISPLQLLAELKPLLEKSENPKAVFCSSKLASIGYSYSGEALAYRGAKSALNSMVNAYSLGNKWLCTLLIHPGWVKSNVGGRNALLSPIESAQYIVKIIERKVRNHCEFFDFNGNILPW